MAERPLAVYLRAYSDTEDSPMDDRGRCSWAPREPLISYHDHEWGVPLREEQRLFEFLILEGAQAGLSWETVLKKREGYRRAFDGFDPEAIARYGDSQIARLLADPGIVRNRAKILATIANARALLAMWDRGESFSELVWTFVGGIPRQNYRHSLREVPAQTDESRTMSRELAQYGFKFVGPTICYAFMQATGMVNDHTVDCFRHREVHEMAQRATPIEL